jgi:hypothetical protein
MLVGRSQACQLLRRLVQRHGHIPQTRRYRIPRGGRTATSDSAINLHDGCRGELDLAHMPVRGAMRRPIRDSTPPVHEETLRRVEHDKGVLPEMHQLSKASELAICSTNQRVDTSHMRSFKKCQRSDIISGLAAVLNDVERDYAIEPRLRPAMTLAPSPAASEESSGAT